MKYLKLYEEITSFDFQEDWEEKSVKGYYIRYSIRIDGNDVNLYYKELDELPYPDVLSGELKSGAMPYEPNENDFRVYLKEENNLRYTQPTTFLLLEFLGRGVKKIISDQENRVDNITLFVNLLELNSKLKPTMGMMNEEWFSYMRSISIEE